jgi:type II secretory pathway pseudopilin PulG
MIRARSYSGATLVELLAVILILMMITAMTIPAVAPAVSGRRTREAARMVSAFLNAARSRAIETGRPAGVWIERVPGLPEAAVSMFFAEVPPIYGGDFLDSTVEAVVLGPDGLPHEPYSRNWMDYYNVVIPRSRTSFLTDAWSNPDPAQQQLVRAGDLIEFEGYDRKYPLKILDIAAANMTNGSATTQFQIPPRGETKWWYILRGRNCSASTGPNGAYTEERVGYSPRYVIRWFDDLIYIGNLWDNVTVETTRTPFNFDAHGVRYKIYRQPIRIQAGAIRLPEGTVIDLNFSTMTGGFFSDSGIPFHPRRDTQQVVGAGVMPIPYWGDAIYPNDDTPVIIIFSASGTVERVYSHQRDQAGNWGWQGLDAYGPIYLLIGDLDHVNSDCFHCKSQTAQQNMDIQFNKNWLNLNALWVRLTPNTGNISTSLVDDVGYLTADADATWVAADPSNVRLSRANKAQFDRLIGGR